MRSTLTFVLKYLHSGNAHFSRICFNSYSSRIFITTFYFLWWQQICTISELLKFNVEFRWIKSLFINSVRRDEISIKKKFYWKLVRLKFTPNLVLNLIETSFACNWFLIWNSKSLRTSERQNVRIPMKKTSFLVFQFLTFSGFIFHAFNLAVGGKELWTGKFTVRKKLTAIQKIIGIGQ